jgi:predicted ATP-grasp superfamily ATP-dependent carboligase
MLPSLEGRTLIDGLKSLAREFDGDRPVLMLGGDRQVALVSAARAELEAHYRISMPAPDRVRALADKAEFQAFAQSHGLPVPRTVVVNGPDGLLALADLPLPAVIKPADKAQVLDGHAERAVRVETLAEARATAARMTAAAGSVVAQEWIEGDDSDIYFALFVCDRASRVLGLFSGRKLVCTPPHVGNTAICAPAGEHAAAVAQLATQFVSVAGYRGIGGVEFKRDSRTGRFVIIEPTVGRTDWQSEVATLNGVNLPLLAMMEALDRPAGALAACAGGGASADGIDEATGWRSSAGFRRPAGLAPPGLALRDGYFRFGDPLPGLYYYVIESFARRLRRRLVRMFGHARAPAREIPPVERSA